MNIFYLSEDPRQAAEWMVDKHVVKMILETAQILSTAHRVLDGKKTIVSGWIDDFGIRHRKKTLWVLEDSRDDILYTATHINHPSSVWARQSVENYNWLVDHLFALGNEYHYRYGKRHATITKLGFTLQSPPFSLKDWDATPMPCCMPDECKISNDPVLNYQEYYRTSKTRMHSWKSRDVPSWIS
jgi:hypothetical protein